MRLYSIFFVVIILAFLGFGLSHILSLSKAPSITILSHKPHQQTDNFVQLVGKVEQTVALTVNGREILPDDKGLFETDLVLPEGYSIVSVHARDRFGRKDVVQLPLYIKSYATSKKENKGGQGVVNE